LSENEEKYTILSENEGKYTVSWYVELQWIRRNNLKKKLSTDSLQLPT
jgi:hypothetical protein